MTHTLANRLAVAINRMTDRELDIIARAAANELRNRGDHRARNRLLDAYGSEPKPTPPLPDCIDCGTKKKSYKGLRCRPCATRNTQKHKKPKNIQKK